MATREQLYLRCLILLYVCINNKIFLCTIFPHGKLCCPYSYTNKAEGGSGCLCASQKLSLELIWWEYLHFLTILLYRYALRCFYLWSPGYFAGFDRVDQTYMFAPESLNIHYWFYRLKVKMLSEETWKTSLNQLNLKTNRNP